MYRIMLVEDEPIVQQALSEALRLAGFEVLIRPDGRSALQSASQDKPDLVLLDINLPDMSGFDICRSLKADPDCRHIPVLILTGQARETAQRVEGLELGAEDYLFKPISPRLLVSRIRSLLKLTSKPM